VYFSSSKGIGAGCSATTLVDEITRITEAQIVMAAKGCMEIPSSPCEAAIMEIV
jgi:hypothetical protein